MWALVRNPLLGLLRRLWWLPALTLVVAAFGLAGEQGLRLAGLAGAAYLSAVAGIAGMAWADGVSAAPREPARRRSLRDRFLCPHCLNFGGFHLGCGACEKKIEAFFGILRCPHCLRSLLIDERGIRAYCEWCNGTCDHLHHERQVRVRAMLLPADFASFCQATGAQERQAHTAVEHADEAGELLVGLRLRDPESPASWLTSLKLNPHEKVGLPFRHPESPASVGYAYHDNGVWLTYVLNLSRQMGSVRFLPPMHAFWKVEFIWLDAGGDDPEKLALELGQAADRFIRETGLTETRRQSLTICVPQATLHPAVQRVLETRFGRIKYEMASATLSDVID